MKPYEPPGYKYIRIVTIVSLLFIVIINAGFVVGRVIKSRDRADYEKAAPAGVETKAQPEDPSQQVENTSQTEVFSIEEKVEEAYSEPIVLVYPEQIPEYRGEISVILDGNKPGFTDYEIENTTGEHYSEPDRLGRCGTAFAMIDEALMPTEERGAIGQVKPSGWNQKKYPGIVNSEPPYLYNRCHLIAYSLTGENANEQNLITGTRYFNTSGMQPFEMKVLDYMRNGGQKVLYRVTPYFKENELVSRGVEMEAYSVNDAGGEICFHVFVYNVQPGIEIDYSTGMSREVEE